jgi:hypothetical protein
MSADQNLGPCQSRVSPNHLFCSGLTTFGALDPIQTLSAPVHFLRKRNAHVD